MTHVFDKKIGKIAKTIDSIKVQMESLKKEFKNQQDPLIKKDVEDIIKEQIKDSGAKISEIHAKSQTTDSKIDTIKTEIKAEINAKIDANKADIDEKFAQLMSKFDEISSKIAPKESELLNF